MKILYMGTPEPSAEVLRALVASPHHIVGVVTQEDQPSGRGKHLTSPPVKTVAVAKNLPLYQPGKLTPELLEELRALEADVVIVVAYGRILPSDYLTLAPHGCINVHYSLLPAYRGAAPVQHALLHGDTTTGVSIMALDAGMDTGPVYSTTPVAIASGDTTTTLLPKLNTVGIESLLVVLSKLEAGGIVAVEQVGTPTYAAKISKTDGRVSRDNAALQLYHMWQAYTPWPGLYFYLDEAQQIKCSILGCAVAEGVSTHPVGTLLTKGGRLYLASADHTALEITHLQIAGKNPMSATDFLNGYGKYLGNVVY
jgi:methionyl-tRNA formyltransferase